MEVTGLLIESFTKNDEAVTAEAVICRFDRPSYVGVRRASTAETVDSAGIVDPEPSLNTKRFPERLLPIDAGRRPAFSYSEPWTVPPWTLYLLAPPSGFHAQVLRVQLFDSPEEVTMRPASDEGALFYFGLVQGSGERVAFQTEARFAYDPAAAERTAARAEHVTGTRWSGLWVAIAAPLSTMGDVASVAAAIKMLIGRKTRGSLPCGPRCAEGRPCQQDELLALFSARYVGILTDGAEVRYASSAFAL